MPNKSIAEMSYENSILVSEISRLERGTVATYAEHFSKWLERPIRCREDLPNFTTVITRVRTDYGIVLSSIAGTGYRLLTHEETVRDDHQTSRARRAASRRKKELACVETSALTDLDRQGFAVKLMQAHLIEESAGSKALKKITAAANGSTQPLALTQILDALKPGLTAEK